MAVQELAGQETSLDLYIAPMGDTALRHCGVLAGEIRRLGLSVETGTGGKLKRMMELANRANARFALIVGDNEIVTKSYALKDMSSSEQTTLTRRGLLEHLARLKQPLQN